MIQNILLSTSLHRFLCSLLLFIGLYIHCDTIPSAVAQNEGEKIEITQRDYENQQIEMADTFRQEGKIYVVVAVLTTIFIGITLYLLLMERRLRKIEKELNE
ncbi:MAG: CcmD family protein [Bernardetiaceae bacterium]|nr:CcmD family protein [Bernardetiaceae bacterium]